MIADGVVYAGEEAGFLFAIEAVSGVERWCFDANDEVDVSTRASNV